ncbi:MAG: hypothetical protein ACRC1M_03530 [Methanobacteriaceae archaeon]
MGINKIKLANVVSEIFNPPILSIPVFILINYFFINSAATFSSNINISPNILNIANQASFGFFWDFIIVELICLIFSTLIPIAIILLSNKYKKTDYDISNRADRIIPLFGVAILYLLATFILYFLNLSALTTILMFSFFLNTIITLLITFKWKISIHAMTVAGVTAALIFCFGAYGALFGLILPILMWSRIELKKHTMLQVICGAILGFSLVFLEMYFLSSSHILLNIHFHQIFPTIYSFFSNNVWYPAAIIGPGLIMTIMGYLNDSGWKDAHTRKLLHIIAFIAFTIFLAFAPFSSIIILILSGIVSIAIASFGGEDFLWFRAVARNADNEEEKTYVILPLLCSGLWLLFALFIFPKEIAIIATLCVALGDAIAEPIGLRFGKHKYTARAIKGPSSQKSIEGSLGVFIVCTLILLVFTQNILLAVLLGLFLSIVEGISPRGTDNITIPVAAAIILTILTTLIF